MASSVKMPLCSLLDMLLMAPTKKGGSATNRTPGARCTGENEARNHSPPRRLINRKNIYLSDAAAQALDRIANDRMENQSRIADEAIVFYEDRGSYLEQLIRTCIKECLDGIKPAVVRHRALVRRAGKSTNMDVMK